MFVIVFTQSSTEAKVLEDDRPGRFATLQEAYDATLADLEREIAFYLPQAKAIFANESIAITKEGLYKGGVVLKLAELMRKHSALAPIKYALVS